ncbi:hypothetical protein HPB51_005803 [Rhipicephalus microplus]|uniref:Uncharacterized protein n=1 Tax=Rhipicephalus microplus TaxID=6941 RepID=A0A9J6ER00_RHIMP|nr:hypothetical protein HPB51_005803 [Rhipicephalus microplus]
MTSTASTIESAATDAADTNEYPVDPDDSSWFTATRRHKPNTTTNSAPELLPAENLVTTQPPPLPLGDFKVIFWSRGGLCLSEWAHHVFARATCMTAGLPGETVNKLRFRTQAERNIATESPPDETTPTKLQAVCAVNLGSHRYEMQAHVAAPDNYCKGVNTGLRRILHPPNSSRTSTHPTPKSSTPK